MKRANDNNQASVAGSVGIWLTGTLLLGLLASCSITSNPVACTAMGCGRSLKVSLTGELPSSYELILRSQEANLHLRCERAEQGWQRIYMEGDEPAVCTNSGVEFQFLQPESLMLKVIWDGSEAERHYQPEYDVYFPNGPQCDPECKSAELVLDLN